MATGRGINVPINLEPIINQQAIEAELGKLKQGIDKSVISEQFMNIGLDDAEARSVLTTIEQQATAIDSVTVKQRHLTDEMGNTQKQAVEMSITYRDGLGNTVKEVKKLEGAFAEVPKGFKVDKITTANLNIGRSVDKLTKKYDAILEQHKRLSKRAQDYASKSANWDSKKHRQMVELNRVLQLQILEYNKLANTQDRIGIGKLGKEIEDQSSQMDALANSTRIGAGAFSKLSAHISNALKQTISYTLSLGLLRQAQQFLNEGIRYTIDLNKELTNIQVLQAEGAKTPEEINSLAVEFNGLAKELGATTAEIAKGSVEWLRQGKTIEETTELLRSSTMLGKLGALSTAEATEYLTSTLNSYRMEAEEAVSVVDKLVAVDNISATSTKELATALRYSAASASEAGVSLEELISYIATVSSTTRQNAESIGQGLKTIFARMEDIKAGALDGDSTGINNVDMALQRVGMTLMDTSGGFKDLGGVMEELAVRWNTIDEIEQRNISKAIAGIRQRNLFLVLMQNMNTALELQEEQYNATGLAADRYEIYLESVEAAQNKFRASMESLWQEGLKSGLIKGLINAGTSILGFIEKIGGLKTVLIALTAALVTNTVTLIANKLAVMGATRANLLYIASTIKAAFATGGFTAAIGALRMALVALSLNPATIWITALGLAVGGLVIAIANAESSIEKLEEKLDKSISTLNDAKNAVKETVSQADNVRSLWEEFEELGKIQGRTAEQAERYKEVQNEIFDILGTDVTGTFDSELNFLIDAKVMREDIIALLEKEIALKKESLLESAKQAVVDSKALLDERRSEAEKDRYSQEKLNALLEEKERLEAKPEEDLHTAELANLQSIRVQISQITKVRKALEDAEASHAKTVLDAYMLMTDEEEKRQFRQAITSENALNAVFDYDKRLRQSHAEEDEFYERKIKYEQRLAGIAEKPKISNLAFIEELDLLEESLKDLVKVREEFEEGEIVSSDDLEKLGILEKDLEIVDGQLRLTEEGYDRVKESLVETIAKTYDLSDAQIEALTVVVDSFGYAVDAVRTYTHELTTLTEEEFSKISGGISSAIWNAVEYLEIALVDINGVVLQSAEQVEAALLNNLITYDAITQQMMQKNADVATSISNYISKAFAFGGGLTPYKPVVPSFKTGGGAKGESEEEKRLKNEIKLLKKKKDALKDTLDEFKDYIKAQKEALKLQREEKKFTDELMKKNKSLAKLKSQIALLALDDSEEARAKRLQLEEEAAELEEDITEDKEERKYELQIHALEQVQEKFEENIQRQLDAIDSEIEKLNDMQQALKELSSGGSGSYQAVGEAGVIATDTIMAGLNGVMNLTEENRGKLREFVDSINDGTKSIIEINRLATLELLRLLELQGFAMEKAVIMTGGRGRKGDYGAYHDGGIVGSDKSSRMVGGLKSNEIFAKLLEGEYVASKETMNTFLSKILPAMAGAETSLVGGGNITIEMPITVQGNLDKSVIPDMEKLADRVVVKLNKTMSNRGYTRKTSLTSI